jgi:predicted RNase H-like HicB family nuclease
VVNELIIKGHTYSLVQEPSEDGYIVLRCTSFPGCCISQGVTEAEALVNIQEAIELFLECGIVAT